MRVLVMSDLHLELGTALALPKDLAYDVAVLAGDIHSPGVKAVHWAQRESTFAGKPVAYVPGNHEFYGREMTTELEAMRAAAEGSNVHLLERDSVVVEGVRFLGCMLWTDFQLPAQKEDGSREVDVSRALAQANRCMNDFRLIEMQSPAKRQSRVREFRRLLRAEDTLAMHWIDRDWLRRELRQPFDGPTVVVTHHAPASGSLAMQYAGDAVTPAFASQLPNEMFEVPDLWVHGHTHTPADYHFGSCRILSNPRGYRQEDDRFENGCFKPLVVELATSKVSCPVDVNFESGDEQLQKPAAKAWVSARAGQHDMVGLDKAADLAGESHLQLRRWAAQRRPRVIALECADDLRFPNWQFQPALWPVVQQLAAALDARAWEVLAWLETPHGALEGRTPRMALEQGELATRLLALAAAEGL